MLNIESESELIKTFIDHSPIAYIIIDRHYRIRFINESFAGLLGIPAPLLIGDVCYAAANNGVRCAACCVAEVLSTGRKAFIARKNIMPDSSVRYIDDYAFPLKTDAQGSVELVIEIMIDRTDEVIARKKRDHIYDEILAVIAQLLEAKDRYTARHSESVRRLSVNLADAMDIPPEDIYDISVAASLHDIGKIDIPYEIINKPDALNDDEYALIKMHTDLMFSILEGLASFIRIREIARHHHERTDGRGYPDGLAGESIPTGSRIIAVADTYDAMTSTRSYRKALPHHYAMQEVINAAGTQLDARAVSAFADMDFGHLVRKLHVLTGNHKPERVVRQFRLRAREQVQATELAALDGIDLTQLLDIVFRHSPCGYVLTDRNRKVLYASDFYLNYTGLRREDVLNKPCFDPTGVGSVPCRACPVKKSIRTGKTERLRHEQFTNHGRKVCEVYGVPLFSAAGTIEYVMKIVVDRTREADLERERREDFRKLIDKLSEVFERHKDEFNERNLPREIAALRSRLNKLLYQKMI